MKNKTTFLISGIAGILSALLSVLFSVRYVFGEIIISSNAMTTIFSLLSFMSFFIMYSRTNIKEAYFALSYSVLTVYSLAFLFILSIFNFGLIEYIMSLAFLSILWLITIGQAKFLIYIFNEGKRE